jgi:hypothetical protein
MVDIKYSIDIFAQLITIDSVVDSRLIGNDLKIEGLEYNAC